MADVRVSKMGRVKIEVECSSSETEKVYKWLERQYPNALMVTSNQNGLYHITCSTEEKKLEENNFVI